MTIKAALLLGLVFGFLLAGLATLNGALVALAIPFVVYLGAAVLSRPEQARITARRELSADHMRAGAVIAVRLTITNAGAPLDQIRVRDALPPGLEIVEGDMSAVAPLAGGASLTLAYTARGARGEHRFGPVDLWLADSLGVFDQHVVARAPGSVVVEPEVTRLRRIALRPPKTRGFAGTIPSRQGGSGIDFLTLREYQVGDRLRSINWKASARHATELFSNVCEQERVADVGLVVDAREQSDIRAGAGSLFEHSLRAAASLADSFLADGNRVGLVVYGSGIESVFPGYGRVQRLRILRVLGRVTSGRNFALEQLDRLPTRFLPAQSQVVLVSPLSKPDVPVLARLKSHGYAILVVSPAPAAFESQWLPDEPALQLALRLARIERRMMLRRLERAGIRVVDWPVDQRLDRVLDEALARQPATGHSLGRRV
jgi:uncharacterized protein (DUF58 family)